MISKFQIEEYEMEQEVKIRYEQTWEVFIQELQTDSTVTLRSVCRKVHTNHNAMSKWLSRHGYSVTQAKKSVLKSRKKEQPAFARLVPKEPKKPLPFHKESSLLGISITFNSGTSINIRQADADSIIRLISLYERKDGDLCTL